MKPNRDLTNKIQNKSSLFLNFIKNAISASPKVQKNFLDVSTKVAETILKIIKQENLLIDLNYEGKEFWKKNKDKTSIFVDGGVDKLSLMSTAPLMIRAGSYTVQPGAKKPGDREHFSEDLEFVGDLYDPKNELYDLAEDDYEEDQMLNKKKDAARIIFEAATIVKHITLSWSDKIGYKRPDFCFLNGPIESTVMPFTVQGFPSFAKSAIDKLLPLHLANKCELNSENRHFVNVYLNTINFIKKSKFPIYGIVEKSNSAPYIKNLLFKYKNKGIISDKDFNNTLSTIKRYKITDTNLLEIILKNNQALKPIEVKKQILGFKVTSGSAWEEKMDEFPNVHIGYIKPSDQLSPFRVESLNFPQKLIYDYEYILATSKLLPHFGYPAGLNVADKFIKIHNWMSRASRNCYTSHHLRKAISNKDQNTISVAVKLLSKRARNWSNRPRTGSRR